MVTRSRNEAPTAITWFSVKWPGCCSACGDPITPGQDAGYTEMSLAGIIKDRLVGRDCCAGSGKIIDSQDEESAFLLDVTAIMPTGKTIADMCRKCFIIHSVGQMECE